MYWLLAHFIGDYLIQNDWMAANKKKSLFACIIHVIAYMIPFLPLLFFDIQAWKLLTIAIQHLIQDHSRFISWFFRVTGKQQFAEPPMAPWSIIVVDNIFHIIFMAIIFSI